MLKGKIFDIHFKDIGWDSVTLFKRNQVATNGISTCSQYSDSPISSSTKENSLVLRVFKSGIIAHKVTMKPGEDERSHIKDMEEIPIIEKGDEVIHCHGESKNNEGTLNDRDINGINDLHSFKTATANFSKD